MNPQFSITVMRGYDGGRIIYETVVDEFGAHESRLVFGGNVDEASKYVAERIARQDAEPPEQEPRQIEPPVKVRVRKQKQEPLAVDLDALELIEGEAD